MTTPGADTWEIKFEQILRGISDDIEEAHRLTVELANGLTGVWHALPPGVGFVVRRAWKDYLELKDEIFRIVHDILTSPGYPPALFRVGEYWQLRVGAKVSELHQAVSAYGMQADDLWTGPAASAYKDSAEAQSRAVGAIKPCTDMIQDVLSDLGWALIAFWVAIAAAVATFIIGLISAAGLVVGVVTAPAAPEVAAGAALASIELIIAAVVALTAYMTVIRSSTTSIRQSLEDSTGLVKQGDTWGWPPMSGLTAADGLWRPWGD
ncbi:MAG TPA: hypothetical protein VFX61_09540 [Micromonosporaceae bacterium]|nr:hypothetical protein [Micromonosporaceae bacterium]